MSSKINWPHLETTQNLRSKSNKSGEYKEKRGNPKNYVRFQSVSNPKEILFLCRNNCTSQNLKTGRENDKRRVKFSFSQANLYFSLEIRLNHKRWENLDMGIYVRKHRYPRFFRRMFGKCPSKLQGKVISANDFFLLFSLEIENKLRVKNGVRAIFE